MKHPQLPEESDQKQKDFYLQLRAKVSEWFEKNADQKPEYANYVLLVPDFFYLLVRLTLDNRIPAMDKAKFAGVIAYFFSPIDFLPEAFARSIGICGRLDFSMLCAQSLHQPTGGGQQTGRQRAVARRSGCVGYDPICFAKGR